MKRMHVHVAVDDSVEAIRFCGVLFAAEPTVRKIDYAKWMLDDPRVNFAISGRDAGCCTPQTLNGECYPPKANRAADAPCCGTSQTVSA
jgi:hypothetical protein